MGKLTYKEVENLLILERFKQISTYRELIELGIQTKWEQLTANISKDDPVDPADIFSQEIAEFQSLQYHGDLLTISLLSELWEQELYNHLSKKFKTPKSNFYKDIKNVYAEYTGEDLDKNITLTQMREVVNAIKHGENCIELLNKKYPDEDFLQTAWMSADDSGNPIPIKRFKFDKNALTSETLNLKGKFEKYQQGILDFWNHLFELEKKIDNNESEK